MSKLNKSLINDLQSLSFEEKLEDTYKTIDFNYLGFDRTNPKSTLLKYGRDANANRVLLWLTSKKLDYVREPDKGGLLYSILGMLNSDYNLSEIENRFRQCFNDEFIGQFNLVMLNLIPDKRNRKLYIYMTVFDKITLSTFKVNTEASL